MHPVVSMAMNLNGGPEKDQELRVMCYDDEKDFLALAFKVDEIVINSIKYNETNPNCNQKTEFLMTLIEALYDGDLFSKGHTEFSDYFNKKKSNDFDT